MSGGLKITGPLSAFKEMVGSAGAFTASDSGAAAYLRYVLIEAADGVITVTAESGTGAIQFEPADLTIEGSGKVLVRHNMLSAVLETFTPDQSPVLEHDAKTQKLSISADENESHLVTAKVGDGAILPSVGEVQRDSGVTVSPDAFGEWYNALAPFRNSGSSPVVSGVYVYVDPDKNLLRGVSMDGKAAASIRPLEVKIVGSGIEKLILEHEGISRALGFFKRGDSVELFLNSETRRIHTIVKSKDRVLYHIWVPLLNVDVDTYPLAAIMNSVNGFAKGVACHVEMKKSDMLQLMRNAANIGALSPAQVDGASKSINLDLFEETFRVSVGSDTDAAYTDAKFAKVEPLDSYIETTFAFGLFGSLLEAYHNEENPELIRFGLVKKASDPDRVVAIIMYFDEIYNEVGDVSDSVMVVPLSARK